MHTVELTGGTIHYETVGPQTGRPVVFIHGYAMGASLWRTLSARLAQQGLRCIAPTWPLGAHPQAMHASALIIALQPPIKSVRFCTSGAMSKWRSAASTSASPNTLFPANPAKAAVMLVFPVPPLPLTTTNSRIIAVFPHCLQVSPYGHRDRETSVPIPA